MTWYAGLSERACFLATRLEDPIRIVIDIEDPPPADLKVCKLRRKAALKADG
jgi:hypothetical protein